MVGRMATQNAPTLFKDSGVTQLLHIDSMWKFGHSVVRYYAFFSRDSTNLKFDTK